MKMTFPRFWRKHRLIVLAFAVALAATLFLSGRLVVQTLYWADPAHQFMPIEPWMTPGYVARSYHLPPDVLRDALRDMGLPEPEMGNPRSLRQIAAALDQPVADLIAEIEQVIATHERPPHD